MGTGEFIQLSFGLTSRDIGTSSFFNIETGGLVLYYNNAFKIDVSGSNYVTGSQTVLYILGHHIVFCRSGTTHSILMEKVDWFC